MLRVQPQALGDGREDVRSDGDVAPYGVAPQFRRGHVEDEPPVGQPVRARDPGEQRRVDESALGEFRPDLVRAERTDRAAAQTGGGRAAPGVPGGRARLLCVVRLEGGDERTGA